MFLFLFVLLGLFAMTSCTALAALCAKDNGGFLLYLILSVLLMPIIHNHIQRTKNWLARRELEKKFKP